MFVDRVTVNLRAGNGGAGVVAFQRQKGRPKGKPIGGSGGGGGDVWIEADPQIATLLTYQHNPHHRAGSGTHGQGDIRHGRQGDDLRLPVPVGTTIFDADGVLLADLVKPGQAVKVLEGGRGGMGNHAFAGPKYKAPNFAEQGEYGPEEWITFELKLVADAALIGFPNAGKSTLIARVSAAKPKIAEYPFTTLQPNLGVVTVAGREFVMADIPGLIEGAADGKGLGHEFLRHTERARALIILLDPSQLQEASVEEQYRVLLSELEAHRPDLVRRPRIVAVNKIELVPNLDMSDLAESLGESRIHAISGITGDGIELLLHDIADIVEIAERIAPQREGYMLHRPITEGFAVRFEGGQWVVSGREAERAVALADLTVASAADFAARRLDKLGVDEALRRAGAEKGDEVRIGDLVFEYSERDEP